MRKPAFGTSSALTLFVFLLFFYAQIASANTTGQWRNLNLNQPVHTVLVDPLNPDTIYALGSAGTEAALWKSTNRGTSWARSDSGVPAAARNFIAIHPENPSVLFMGGETAIYRSDNAGAGWTLLHTRANGDMRQIFVNPRNTQVMLTASATGGVWRSTDGGSSWSAFNTGLTNLNVTVIEIDANDSNYTLAGTSTGELFRWPNNKNEWQPVNNPAALKIGSIHDIAADPVSRVVFAGASPVSGSGSTLIRNLSEGQNSHWSNVSVAPWTSVVPGAILFRSDFSRVYISSLTPESPNVYFSDNYSATVTSWFAMPAMNAITRALAFDAVNQLLYAGNTGAEAGVYVFEPVPDTTPPVTNLGTNPLSPDGANGWFSSVPTVSLLADEPGTTFYSWQSAAGPWVAYTDSFTAPEGEKTLYYYSTDIRGNTEQVKSQLFKVDTGTPVAHITAPASDATVGGSVSVTGTASDTASGVVRVEISPDGTTWHEATGTTNWTSTLTMPPQGGNCTIRVRATDAAGHAGEEASVTVFVDVTPPSVAETVPANDAVGFDASVSISAVFSEDLNPATVNASTFTVSGVSGTVTYDAATRTATFTPEGDLADATTYTATVTAAVADLVGNSMNNSYTWSFTTKYIDRVAPVTSLTVTPAAPGGSEGWYTGIHPSIQLERNKSGITYYSWSADGPFNEYSGPLTVTDGERTLRYYSVNDYGFEESVREFGIKVDTVPPPAPVFSAAVAAGTTEVSLTWLAPSDAHSGVNGYRVYTAAGEMITDTALLRHSVTGLSPGQEYSYTIRAYDTAGNVSEQSNTLSVMSGSAASVGFVSGAVKTVNMDGKSFHFENITTPGTVTVLKEEPPPEAPIPDGQRVVRDSSYHITTTAVFDGKVTVTLPYNGDDVTRPRRLSLLHWNGTAWEDITVSVNTTYKTITGVTNSFSPYTIVESTASVPEPEYDDYGMNTYLLWFLALGLFLTGIRFTRSGVRHG